MCGIFVVRMGCQMVYANIDNSITVNFYYNLFFSVFVNLHYAVGFETVQYCRQRRLRTKDIRFWFGTTDRE